MRCPVSEGKNGIALFVFVISGFKVIFLSYSYFLRVYSVPSHFFYFLNQTFSLMRHVKFFATVAVASGILLLSCNSGDKKASDTAADTTAVKKDSVLPPPVVASGPSMIMTITHEVANYAKWKSAYDGHDSNRLSYGLHNYVICRGVDDSNMVMVAMRMDDVNKAKEMGGSKELMERMKKAGVSKPSIEYSEAVMNDTTAIQQTVRVMVKHKVKDWSAWKKAFDSHKQIRMDAGLTDRVVGHAVGDDHSVFIVLAVADVAKAKAFMESKNLKDKMDSAGVVGPPTAFYYRVAARY
jgi:hypothetical protein